MPTQNSTTQIIQNDNRAAAVASNITQMTKRKRQLARLALCKIDLADYVIKNAPAKTPVTTVNEAIFASWQLLGRGSDYQAAVSTAMEYIENANKQAAS